MKLKFILSIILFYLISNCVGKYSKEICGTGGRVALDPRSMGTQIEEKVMKKSLSMRLLLKDKK